MRLSLKFTAVILSRGINLFFNAITGILLARFLSHHDRGVAASCAALVSTFVFFASGTNSERIFRDSSKISQDSLIIPFKKSLLFFFLVCVCVSAQVFNLQLTFFQLLMLNGYFLLSYSYSYLFAWTYHHISLVKYQNFAIIHVLLTICAFIFTEKLFNLNVTNWLVSIFVCNLMSFLILYYFNSRKNAIFVFRGTVNFPRNRDNGFRESALEHLSVFSSSLLTQILTILVGLAVSHDTVADFAILMSVSSLFLLPITPFVPQILKSQVASTLQSLKIKKISFYVAFFVFMLFLMYLLINAIFIRLYGATYSHLVALLGLTTCYSAVLSANVVFGAILRSVKSFGPALFMNFLILFSSASIFIIPQLSLKNFLSILIISSTFSAFYGFSTVYKIATRQV